MGLKSLLALPAPEGGDLSRPAAIRRRRRLLSDKPFLERLYREWYGQLAARLPPGARPVLELGSGGGFLAELRPDVITSDVVGWGGELLAADAAALPFAAASLGGIVMVNVLHHLTAPSVFLDDAARAVEEGGVVAMIEPWVSAWSRLVYGRLHHEPFDPAATAWEAPAAGPLAGANSALPWIMLERDRQAFAARHPQWQVLEVAPRTPLRYLLSGGLSMRALAPAWSFPLWRALERAMAPVAGAVGMFALIVLRRR